MSSMLVGADPGSNEALMQKGGLPTTPIRGI